ncbi:MAG TPA: hypothetical protein VHD55_02455 [Candidatus Paceibacterota bacterium]|nr:hypothetical protein [Candidatus Paceibacterota bacterium]
MSNAPITFVIFGATGDLAQRKIVPALCALYASGALPEGSDIVAFSRRPWGDAEYRSFIQPSLKAFPEEKAVKFLERIRYVQGTFGDPASFAALKDALRTQNIFFHLAVQPEFYESIVHGLGDAGLQGSLLIEKPFGHNYASAASLERGLEKYFSPEHIFRVDHYLGKEGLEVLLNRRRTDADFEKSLSSERIASVAVRLLETFDVEGRGEFYDAAGALKDVGQNHLLEMLATLLMNIPEDARGIPQARAEAIAGLAPKMSVQGAVAAVRGQYEGYHADPEIPDGSQTETYFKVELRSAIPRWQDVPLVLEAGKALREKKSDIEISYKDGSKQVFDMDIPGARDAYEHMIEAALRGDATRFAGSEEVFAAWKLIDPLREQLLKLPLHRYDRGGDGAGRFL